MLMCISVNLSLLLLKLHHFTKDYRDNLKQNVTYEIHLLSFLTYVFSCLPSRLSLFHQDSWYYNYFQAVCLNAKIIYAKFVTEKYKDLLGMFHIFS